MSISRRAFLTALGLAPCLAAAPAPARFPICGIRSLAAMGATVPPGFRVSGPTLNANALARFVDPLPWPVPAQAQGTRPDPSDPGRSLLFYRLRMLEFEARVHRDVPPTRQWGYAGSVPGPTLETRSGEGLLVEWVNALPERHFLPVDRTIHGAEAGKPEVRVVAHVHGAKAPPDSDGYPEQWLRAGQSALFHYPARQDAATLWYHDHAMGITRLNVFAGLMGAFLVRDDAEQSLGLPPPERDLPLLIYDRQFDTSGQLQYPRSLDERAPWVAEFYGNAVLCNGRLFPYLEVEPGRYRLRLINAANTRFFTLTLSDGQPLQQVGSDQGLLPAPVRRSSLVLYPGERADVLVDFSHNAGTTVHLCQQGNAIVEFRVARMTPRRERALPATLRAVPRLNAADARRDRVLTLGEVDDASGRSVMMLLNKTRWHEPITEKPVLDSIEIWSLVNLTGDAHPVHLHLVRFQIIERRPFDLFAYDTDGTVQYTGPAIPPEPGEGGWKDTVRADAGMVTRIIVKFEGYTGRYVWHCHLLEHEDLEMMRPYEVVAA